MKITIEDVAREAGVSTATVSRVINNNYPVAEQTRIRVEKIISELEFTPNALAKGLMLKKTLSIGVIIPSVLNPYFLQVVKQIENYCKEKGYMTLLCHAELPEEEQEYIKNLSVRSVDGIILVDGTTENRINGYYEKIAKTLPLVLINGLHQGVKCNFVMADQETGTLDALKYLYALGHRNIGFVSGDNSEVHSYVLKEKVYKGFLKEKSLPFDDMNIMYLAGELENDSLNVAAAREMLKQRLEKPNPPTAIFASNDIMAIALISGAKELGFHVPDDLSIIGFDNSFLAQITSPQLTTVDINTRQLGMVAAKMLIDIIENEKKDYEKVIINTNLVIRDSCKDIGV